MAIGWSISIGYISGYSTKETKETAWKLLRAFAESLMNDPQRIYDECIRIGLNEADIQKEYDDSETLMSLCEMYKFPMGEGGPVSIVDKINPIGALDSDEDEDPFLHIMASGGGIYRAFKEHAARAFVRLCVEYMHTKNIDIRVSVG